MEQTTYPCDVWNLWGLLNRRCEQPSPDPFGMTSRTSVREENQTERVNLDNQARQYEAEQSRLSQETIAREDAAARIAEAQQHAYASVEVATQDSLARQKEAEFGAKAAFDVARFEYKTAVETNAAIVSLREHQATLSTVSIVLVAAIIGAIAYNWITWRGRQRLAQTLRPTLPAPQPNYSQIAEDYGYEIVRYGTQELLIDQQGNMVGSREVAG